MICALCRPFSISMTVSDEGSDFEYNNNDSGSDFVDSGDESDFEPQPPTKKVSVPEPRSWFEIFDLAMIK